MTRFTIAFAVSVTLACSGASASALPGLAQEADINEGLLIMAVADKIRRECDGIGGRLMRARKFAGDLEDVARAKGYSAAQVDAFLDDKQERARVRALRNDYFASHGASNLDAQSLCVLGYDEIARKSLIGHLLKAK